MWLYSQQKSFSFSVQACESAVVFLTDHPHYGSPITDYEITIGDRNNSAISLRKYNATEQVIEASEPVSEPLNCTEPRSFWVSWYDYTFEVGTSADNILLTWKETGQPIAIHVVGVFTLGVDAQWKFSRDMGEPSLLLLKPSHLRATTRTRPISPQMQLLWSHQGENETDISEIGLYDIYQSRSRSCSRLSLR